MAANAKPAAVSLWRLFAPRTIGLYAYLILSMQGRGFSHEIAVSRRAVVQEEVMKHRTLLIAIAAAAILAVLGIARADEGMWLYNFPPTAKIKAKYGFELTKAWLDHTRLSSVRFDNGGSGSFVSADGLVFTNHHIAAECVQDLSSNGKDYMKTGFYAKTHADEAKCPDLELNVLENIADVTDKV